MSEELKPCPFCGGEAEWDEQGVSCSNVEGCDFDAYVDRERWNIRPVEDALRAEIERLRKSIKKWNASLEVLRTEESWKWAMNEMSDQVNDAFAEANSKLLAALEA